MFLLIIAPSTVYCNNSRQVFHGEFLKGLTPLSFFVIIFRNCSCLRFVTVHVFFPITAFSGYV